jgi:DNA mismatch repair ATPase MutS
MEVKMIRAIEEVQTIQDILASMGMDDVEKNSKAHTVRSVDELFQIVRRAVTRRRSEEVCDLIAEGLDKALDKRYSHNPIAYTHKRNTHAP